MTNGMPHSAPSPALSPALSPAGAAGLAMQRVGAMVAVASGLAATGRAIDLAGIDAAAGRLCAQVLDLPPPLGAVLRPELVALDAAVGRLAELLRTRPT